MMKQHALTAAALAAFIGCGGTGIEKETARGGCDRVIRTYHQAAMNGDFEAMKSCLGSAQLAEIEGTDPSKKELAMSMMKEMGAASIEPQGFDYLHQSKHLDRAVAPPDVDKSRGLGYATYVGKDGDGNTVTYRFQLYPADTKGLDWKIFKLNISTSIGDGSE